VTLKIPDSCSSFSSIQGTVKIVGSRAIWVEDNARPTGGFSDAQYQNLAASYDGVIGEELDKYLGSATDFDGNGRVVIVVTPAVNEREGIHGFMTTADFIPPVPARRATKVSTSTLSLPTLMAWCRPPSRSRMRWTYIRRSSLTS
jgi:hypothetical protein